MSDSKLDRCGVCKGSKSEHFDGQGKPITQHAYVGEGGPLLTQKEAAEARGPQQPVPMPVPAYMGNAGLSVARLVELMIERGIFTAADGLYIAGFGPKPAPSSGYQDPAADRGFSTKAPGGGV